MKHVEGRDYVGDLGIDGNMILKKNKEIFRGGIGCIILTEDIQFNLLWSRQ
jgi:hypothetical protein